MTLEQRLRAIRLLEMIEREPELAQELGISVRQKINDKEIGEERRWRGGDSGATAR